MMQKLDQYHGQPSGNFATDEFILRARSSASSCSGEGYVSRKAGRDGHDQIGDPGTDSRPTAKQPTAH